MDKVELVNEKRYNLLNGNEEMHLQKLGHLGRQKVSKLKVNAVWVRKHLYILQKTITKLEKKCGEPAAALLQVSLEETLS